MWLLLGVRRGQILKALKNSSKARQETQKITALRGGLPVPAPSNLPEKDCPSQRRSSIAARTPLTRNSRRAMDCLSGPSDAVGIRGFLRIPSIALWSGSGRGGADAAAVTPKQRAPLYRKKPDRGTDFTSDKSLLSGGDVTQSSPRPCSAAQPSCLAIAFQKLNNVSRAIERWKTAGLRPWARMTTAPCRWYSHDC